MCPIDNNDKKYSVAPSCFSSKLTLNVTLCAACLLFNATYTQGADAKPNALYDLSLEELGQIQVTLVSKKKERLLDAAGSIYVITGEAISRAGARTLPEALRLAPNLQVAQINANQYAISARGFNSSTANKLLVMIDGRIVYTPLYSGVFWDVQDIMLEDIEQIEIVSGPGGTLWGTNAVNGVINIITKSAKDTQGNLVHTTASNKERGIAIRHGGNFDNNRGGYRIYAKADQWSHSVRASGVAEPDAWDRQQIGFRTDWQDSRNDLKILGNSYRNSIDQLAPGDITNSGTNLLARWNRKLAGGSTLRLRTYIDHSTHDTPGLYRERLNIIDVDAQQSLPEDNGRQLIWGGGYRVAHDQVDNSAVLGFIPADRTLDWISLFAQQEMELWSRWQLILGARLENNDYTGTEFLPNLKLAWKLSDHQLLWTSLSRAVRAPSRIDRDFYARVGSEQVLGGADFRSEIANTLELGWRTQVNEAFSYSWVVYHSEYDHLRSLALRIDDSAPGLQAEFANQVEGHSTGVEALLTYQLTHAWRMEANAVRLAQDFNGTSLDKILQGNDPRWQWGLRSTWNLSRSQQFGLSLRHVDKLPLPEVPAYTSLDAHYAWTPLDSLAITLTGRNLSDPRHQEFAAGSGIQLLDPIQVEREIDVALRVKF